MKVSGRRLYDSWGSSSGTSSSSSSSSSSSDISENSKLAGSMLEGADLDALSKQFEEGLGIVAGIIEQVRVVLDQSDFVADAFGKDIKIPYWAKSLVGGLDFVSELADCVMRSEDNQVKLIMCPAKYASAATDFLESLDNVMGIDGANFFGKSGTSSSTAPVSSNQFTQAAPAPAPSAWGAAPAAPAAAPQGNSLWGR